MPTAWPVWKPKTPLEEVNDLVRLSSIGPPAMVPEPIKQIQCTLCYVNVRRELCRKVSYCMPVTSKLHWDALALWTTEPAQKYGDDGTTTYVMEDILWFLVPDKVPPSLSWKYELQKWPAHESLPVPWGCALLSDLNEIYVFMREEVPVVPKSILKTAGKPTNKTKRVHFQKRRGLTRRKNINLSFR